MRSRPVLPAASAATVTKPTRAKCGCTRSPPLICWRSWTGSVSGSDSYPALAGQADDYLRARLRSWRAGAPAGAPVSVMNLIARTLGDAEIDALSAWLARQPRHFPGSPAPPFTAKESVR